MEQGGDTRPPRPARDDVRIDGSPVRCPYCHGSVDVGTHDWVACAGCLARHHADCWGEGGRCGACKRTESLRRDAPSPAMAGPPSESPDTTRAPAFSRTFAGEVGPELDELVIRETRNRLGAVGRFERLGRSLTWWSSLTDDPGVTVRLTSREGTTTLEVRDVAPAGALPWGIVALHVPLLLLLATVVGSGTTEASGSGSIGVAAGLLTLVPFVYVALFRALPRLKQRELARAAKVAALSTALEREVGGRVRPLRRPDSEA